MSCLTWACDIGFPFTAHLLDELSLDKYLLTVTMESCLKRSTSQKEMSSELFLFTYSLVSSDLPTDLMEPPHVKQMAWVSADFPVPKLPQVRGEGEEPFSYRLVRG